MKKPRQKYFRSEIQRQAGYQLQSYPKAIKLNQNELPCDFSDEMKTEVLRRWKRIPMQRYPEVQPYRLREALAKELKVRPEQLLVSNGSNVLIQSIAVSAAIGGTVMALEPSFALYELAAKGLGNRFIPLSLRKADFSLDLAKALVKIKKARPQLIFIANPNAPTGNLMPLPELQALIDAAPGLVVVDEAYRQFSKTSLLPQLRKFPNLILLQTFSKGFGLGGGRLGYLISHRENVAEIAKVLTPYCVNRFAEEQALVALKYQRHFEKIIANVLQQRERVFQALMQLPAATPFPSDANFILFRVANAKRCFQHLLRKGILVRDQSSYPKLAGCLRVTIGTKRENDAFLRAMRAY